jgi:hypothetical protein
MGYIVEREYVTETRIERKEMKRLEDWRQVSFQSSTGKTEEFKAFARMFRARIKKEAGRFGLSLADFNTGHFYASGFLKNERTGNYVYFSTDDVRGSSRWYTDILVRSAKNEKDYTGGINQSASIPKFGEACARIAEGGRA